MITSSKVCKSCCGLGTLPVRGSIETKRPSRLLKLIPLSTDTLEERGSLAIQKELEKQVGPNLERFRSAYIKWLTS